MEKLCENSKTKFKDYLRFYHYSQLDEVRLHLENDSWELCPADAFLRISDKNPQYKSSCILTNIPDYISLFKYRLEKADTPWCSSDRSLFISSVFDGILKKTHVVDNSVSRTYDNTCFFLYMRNFFINGSNFFKT